MKTSDREQLILQSNSSPKYRNIKYIGKKDFFPLFSIFARLVWSENLSESTQEQSSFSKKFLKSSLVFSSTTAKNNYCNINL